MPSGQGLPFYASLDDSAFVRGIRSMENQAEAAAKKIGAAFATAGTAITASTAAFAGFAAFEIGDGVRQVFDLTKGLGELSDQTGVSVGRLYELGREFQNAGMEADDAGAAINKMQKFLQQGGPGGDEKTYDALRLLHLNFLQIKQLSPEHQFDAIGKAIAGLDSPTQRAAASMEIFGKSGGRLLRVFSDPKFANGGDLGGRAEILQKNAALFEEASVKLSHAGDIFKSFYTGLAERAASPLVAVLDRLEATDLTKYGEMFGDDLLEGATGVVEMLVAIKKSDIVSTAKDFSGWLKWGADQVADVLGGFKDMFASDVKDLKALSALFSGRGGTSSGSSSATDAPAAAGWQEMRGAPTVWETFMHNMSVIPGQFDEVFVQPVEKYTNRFVDNLDTAGKQIVSFFKLDEVAPLPPGGTLQAEYRQPPKSGMFDRFFDYESKAFAEFKDDARAIFTNGASRSTQGAFSPTAASAFSASHYANGVFAGAQQMLSDRSSLLAHLNAPTLTGKSPTGVFKGWDDGPLKTGSLFSSGLSGPGSDTAENARQNFKSIRDQV